MRHVIYLTSLLLFAWTGSAMAQPYGCDHGASFDPVPGVIDYYIETDLATNGLGSLSGSAAVWSIRAAIERLHRQSGANVSFKYRGTTSTLDCTPSTDESEYATPTVIIKRTTTCDVCVSNGPACANSYLENGTEMNCGWILFIDGSGDCSEHAWGAYGDNNPASEDDIIKTTIHEMMHVLRIGHLTCVDHLNDDSVMKGYASRRRSLSRADRKYLRSRYGFNSAAVTYQWDSAFGPASWTEVSGTPATTSISPAVMTVQDDTNRGVGFLTSVGSVYESEMRMYICEGGSCSVESPISANVFQTPAVARSFGTDDRWLLAGLYGDSMTSYEKDIYVARRDFGGSWSYQSLNVNTDRPFISAAYDDVTESFVITFVNDSDEIEVAFADVNSSTWYYTDTNIKAFDGATVACDEVADNAEGNCMLAWSNIEANHGGRWARFEIDTVNDTISIGPVRSTGWLTSARPSIANNVASDGDPEFLMSFVQAGRTMYVRTLNGGSTSWSGGPAVTADDDTWLGPGNAGFRSTGGFDYSYLYYSE